jgi:drug/metabolite transporter (DMT)-like permease
VVALCLGVTLGGEVVSTWEWLASGVVMVGIVLLLNDQRISKAPVPPRLEVSDT